MEPRIETMEVRLVGVQGVVRVDREFVQDLKRLYTRLFTRLDRIPDVSPAKRTVGYWQFIDHETRVYFAGVEVASLEHFEWDYAYGLAGWSLGETTWAIWPEEDGREGSIVHGNICWDWLSMSNCDYDSRFMGDFEVRTWAEIGTVPKSGVHEIWIPVVEKSVGDRGQLAKGRGGAHPQKHGAALREVASTRGDCGSTS
jgi:predicted transcriptional regulator YdeE